MSKKKSYYYKEIPIENLLLNPDNARYVYTTELPDEISSIKELLNILETQIIALAKDIASDELNPNELPTVSPLIDDKDKFVVLDGNRRIACIKLMTTYKDNLESFGFSKKIVNLFKGLTSDIKNVYCVVFEEESLADSLLEKIHTSVPGVGQVKWDPLAQDKHKAKLGDITHRHALIELLKFSKHTPAETLEQLKKTRWFSKLDRFAKNNYMRKFGITFIDNDNIQLFLEEKEVIKGLCQLISDLQDKKATEIAQTEEVRDKYLQKFFPADKLPDPTKINKNKVIFNVTKKVMEVYEESTQDIESVEDNQISIESLEKSNLNVEKIVVENKQNITIDQTDYNKSSSDIENDMYETDASKSISSTKKQYSLIPENSYIDIKDTRTRELFEELKKVSAYSYKNTVAIAFRSLIEFSIDCFLISRNGKSANIPDNPHITLVEKIEKVYSQLESIYGNNTLKQKMPAIQFEMQNYRDKKGLDTIKILNLCVHHSNYYPDSDQLKTLYKNVEPFLKMIWENVK